MQARSVYAVVWRRIRRRHVSGNETEPAAAIWRRRVDDRHREADELSNAMTLGGARWYDWFSSARLGLATRDGADFHDRIGRYEIRGIESGRLGRRAGELSARASAGCVLLAWNGLSKIVCACTAGRDSCERRKERLEGVCTYGAVSGCDCQGRPVTVRGRVCGGGSAGSRLSQTKMPEEG